MSHPTQELLGLLSRTAPLDPAPAAPRTAATAAACGHLDNEGRITDRNLLASLGWEPGDTVFISRHGHGLMARPAQGSPLAHELARTVDPRGRLLIPRSLRQALGLIAGEPFLLIAQTDRLHLLPVNDLLDLLLTHRSTP